MLRSIVRTYHDWMFTLAMVGRPNVGKSSLFNTLSANRSALVDNMPGLTRDRVETMVNLFDVDIKLVDTAGWDPHDTENPQSIIDKMIDQTHQALIGADLALFLIDARQGITAHDINLSRWLRNNKKDVILVANKCEPSADIDISNDVYKLGFGEPLQISAEHRFGIGDLYAQIKSYIPESYIEQYNNRVERRQSRYDEIKQMAREEILTAVGYDDFDEKQWNEAYSKYNNPDLSDYDSDNEIDPEKTVYVDTGDKSGVNSSNEMYSKPVTISIIGRPNSGKSTLVNRLLNTQRVIVDDLPGTTRDAIYNYTVHKGRKICLVDTAGLHKRNRQKIDELTQGQVNKAIKYSQVCILLYDSMWPLTRLDLQLVRDVLDEGRALMILGNKWDLIDSKYKQKAQTYMQNQLNKNIDLKSLKIEYISAKDGYKTAKVLDSVLVTYDRWNRRVSTGLLNRWLTEFKKVQNLPSDGEKKLKIRFMSQIKSRPPTFYTYVNDRNIMKDNYLKRFTSALAREFNMEGVPIRLIIRDQENKPVRQKKSKGFKIRSKVGKSVFTLAN